MEIETVNKLITRFSATIMIIGLSSVFLIGTFSASANQDELDSLEKKAIPVFSMQSEKKIEITFDFLELDNQKKVGKAKGKVFAKRNDFVICCNEAYISYNNDTVETIICKDHVQMYHFQGKQGKSDSALFSSQSNLITMTGNPMLIENDNILSGDTIIYDVKLDKAKVEGNAKITWNPKAKKSDNSSINFQSWSYKTCAQGSSSL